MIFVGEHHLHLAYYLEDSSPDWDGTTVRIVGENTTGEPVALIEFTHLRSHVRSTQRRSVLRSSIGFSWRWPVPRSRGSSFVVDSAVGAYEHRASVPPPELFARYRHFIFAFHDTTFECIAEAFSITVHTGSVAEILGQHSERFRNEPVA